MPEASSRVRMARYRDGLRHKGLRPIQIWVPDTRAPGFREALGRQIELINAADRADGTLAWLETVSLFDDHEAG